MGELLEESTCLRCGEKITVIYNTISNKETQISMCRCDRFEISVETFLKDRNLYDEFVEYFNSQEKARRRRLKSLGVNGGEE